MSSLTERLQKLYGDKKEPTGDSWIPHRNYKKGSLWSEMRANATPVEGVGSARMEEILLLAKTKAEIFERTAYYLLEEYGEDKLEVRLGNFADSWDVLFEKYGEDLIYALIDKLEQLNEEPFVNHMGYINKKTAKNEVRRLKAERRDQ